MRFHLPTFAFFDTFRRARAEREALFPLAAVLLAAAFVVLAGVHLFLPARATTDAVLGGALLAAATLAAASTTFAAVRAPQHRRLPWVLFATGTIAAFVSRLLRTPDWVESVAPALIPWGTVSLLVLFYLLVAGGAVIALTSVDVRRFAAEIALDTALVIAIAVVLFLHIALEPLAASPIVGGADWALTALVVAHILSIIMFICVVMLVVWPNVTLSPRTVAALLGTTGLFMLTNILGASSLDAERVHALSGLAGWMFLILAGVAGATASEPETGHASPEQVARRMRRSVVPAAALFLGAAALAEALRPDSSLTAGIALAALGVLLAARVFYALREAGQREVYRRELFHSQSLVEVSHGLAGATELDDTLDRVAHLACRLLEAPAAEVELLCDDDPALEVHAVCGLPDDMIGLRYPYEGSFTGWVIHNDRPRATSDTLADPFVDPRSVDYIGATTAAAAPLRFGDLPVGALVVCNREMPFRETDLELLQALATQATIAIENARLFERVERLSRTDPLTQLANRRQMEHHLEREFAAARRGRDLALVLFDLDGFKRYNDTYGHPAGDDVLRLFARVLSTESRRMNLTARYGGDEFLALLTDCDRAGAETFAGRICERFAEQSGEEAKALVTASAGTAEFRPGMETGEDLVAAADRALYEAKEKNPAM